MGLNLVLFKTMHQPFREGAPRGSWRRPPRKVQKRERKRGWKLPGFSPPHPPPDPEVIKTELWYLLRSCDHGCICQETWLILWFSLQFFLIYERYLMTMKRERGWRGRQHLKARSLLWGSDFLGQGCTSGTEEWSQFCNNNKILNKENMAIHCLNLVMASKSASLLGIGGNQVARVRPTRSRQLYRRKTPTGR